MSGAWRGFISLGEHYAARSPDEPVVKPQDIWFTTRRENWGVSKMKTKLAVLLSLLLAFGCVHAEDKKADAKKSEKAKAATKKKSEKKSADNRNAAQKAESNIGDWADKNKIWVRSHKKAADKK